MHVPGWFVRCTVSAALILGSALGAGWKWEIPPSALKLDGAPGDQPSVPPFRVMRYCCGRRQY
jgi:hypothetical protein